MLAKVSATRHAGEMAARSTKPSAQKRPKSAAPLDNASQIIRRILTPEGRAYSADELTAELPALPLVGTGVEPPVPEWIELNQSLFRCFAFVDVCDFTSFTDRYGAAASIEVLQRFRSACRDVTARRGTRVAKWLGDGVMLVGAEPGPIIATVAELLLRFDDDPFDIHAGIAAGPVLLFEGDDHIGRAVNLAARLCEAAGPSEMLVAGLADHTPDWVELIGTVTVRATGIGDITGVRQLRAAEDAVTHHVDRERHPSMLGALDPDFVPQLNDSTESEPEDRG